MRLSQLTIDNHSRLQNCTIEVRDHLVLVGPNDVGKSSILRCVDLLLGATTAGLYARLSATDFRDTTNPLVVEALLEGFDDDDRALFPDEIDVDATSGHESLLVRLEVTTDADGTIDARRFAPNGGTKRQLSREQVAGLKWRTLSAVGSARELRDDRNNPLDDILRAVDLGAEEAEFEALTRQLETKLGASSALGALRAQLADQLTRALPHTVDDDELAFVPGARVEDDALNGIRLQVTRDGVPRGLTDQSDGTRALFAMALYDLVSASANIVGVDEPEIHLHPSGQRSLAKLLQDGPNQKIVATHSGDIVSAFDPEAVATVKAGGVVVQPTPGFLNQQEKLVLRWWVHDRLEPLTARHVIVVEGISDRILVERAAEVSGRDLDRLGISIVQAEGSGEMQPFLKLFGPGGFDIATSILIDKDAEAETAAALGVATGDLHTRSVFVSDPDLEGEYIDALGPAATMGALASAGFFTAGQLSACPASGPNGQPTAEELRQFCGHRKRKVYAAMSVAPALTATNVPALTSVSQLLAKFA